MQNAHPLTTTFADTPITACLLAHGVRAVAVRNRTSGDEGALAERCAR